MLVKLLERSFLMGLLLLASGCMPKVASVSGLIDRSWTEANGRETVLGTVLGKRATVFITLDPDCPFCQFYAHDLQVMASRFAADSVKFVGVYAGPFMEGPAAAKFADQAGFTFPQLMDPGCSLCLALRARVTPETFIIDANGVVVYRGAIDDRAVRQGRKTYEAKKHYLADALTAFLRDGTPQPEVTAVGCIVECEE